MKKRQQMHWKGLFDEIEERYLKAWSCLGGSLAEAATALNTELQALDNHQLSQSSIDLCSNQRNLLPL